jgi:hypothetical protein
VDLRIGIEVLLPSPVSGLEYRFRLGRGSSGLRPVEHTVRGRPLFVVVASNDLLDPGHVVGGKVEVADNVVFDRVHDRVPGLVFGHQVGYSDLLMWECL